MKDQNKTEARSQKNPWWTWIAPLIICHIGTQLALVFQVEPGITIWYPPVALSIVMVYWWGPRVLVGLYLNAVLSAGLWGLTPWHMRLLFALPETLTVFLSWLFFIRLLKANKLPINIKKTQRFIIFGLLIPSAAGSFVLSVLFALFDNMPLFETRYLFFNYWIRDVFGGLAISTPLLHLISPLMEKRSLIQSGIVVNNIRPFVKPIKRKELIEIAVYFGILFASSLTTSIEKNWFVYGGLMAVIALRFGFVCVLITNIWITLWVLVAPSIPGAQQMTRAALSTIQLNLSVMFAGGLLIGQNINNLFKEIEERKQIEKTLIQHQEHQQILLKEMLDSFALHKIIWGADGQAVDYTFLQVNNTFEKMTGLRAVDIIGKTIRQVLPDIDPLWIQRYGEVVRTGEASQFEQYSRELGKYYEVRAFCPAPDQFAVTFRDISERKQAEMKLSAYNQQLEETVRQRTLEISLRNQALQKEITEHKATAARLQDSRKLYDLAVETTGLSIYDSQTTSWDFYQKAHWLKPLGYTPDENMDERAFWQSLIHPQDIEMVMEALEAMRQGLVDSLQMEYRLRAKDGRWHWVLDNSRIIERHPNGKTKRMLGTHLDITPRKLIEEAEHEQRMLAETLTKTAALINSTLEIEQTLNLILENVGLVVPHEASTLVLIDERHPEKETVVHSRVAPGFTNIKLETITHHLRLENYRQLYDVKKIFHSRQPNVIPDVSQDPHWKMFEGLEWMRSYVGAPLIFGNRIIGIINLYSTTANTFTAEHAKRLQALADQAAIAVRNAQLYEEVSKLAALEERQRLAREMHDAVSQTLFSAATLAETLPILLERRENKTAAQNASKLYKLNRAALAEMRSLLLELRPQTLNDMDLSDLLQQLADGFAGHSHAKIQLHAEGRYCLPPLVQANIYRIAQEALNNIAKHARAQQVSINFVNSEKEIYLEICDDGRGFDIDKIPTGGMGLNILRERAAQIGADLSINSQPGSGTKIILEWYNPNNLTA